MEATFIIKWGNCYKTVQFRRKMREKEKDNRYWQPTPWFTLYLPDDRQSTLGNSWELGGLKLESIVRTNQTLTLSVSA